MNSSIRETNTGAVVTDTNVVAKTDASMLLCGQCDEPEPPIKRAKRVFPPACKGDRSCPVGQPAFNYPGLGGQYCGQHKLAGMIDVKHAKCQTCGVKRASYRFPGETSNTTCAGCARAAGTRENVFNPGQYQCAFVDNDHRCVTVPSFNLPGEKRGLYCKLHAELFPGMINVISPRCIGVNADGSACHKSRSFAWPDGTEHLYCAKHKLSGMCLATKKKLCDHANCGELAGYRYRGDNSIRMCIGHKLDGMVSLKFKPCSVDNCDNPRSASFRNLANPNVWVCRLHKTDDMVWDRVRTCIEDNCPYFAIFNFADERVSQYCAVHKDPDMVAMSNQYCQFPRCETGTSATHNVLGGKPKFCFRHATEDMIYVTKPKCSHEHCMRVASIRNFDGYCQFCFVNLFPDDPRSLNKQSREKRVVDFLTEEFPTVVWVHNQRIAGGTSARRPDLLARLGTHAVIVEIDERQHEEYNCECEERRVSEIWTDLGFADTVMIRFNPDAYTDQSGNVHESCWAVRRTSGLLYVPTTLRGAWGKRLRTLRGRVKYWLETQPEPENGVYTEQLFYDGCTA